jgi:hypothetical protein
VSFFAIFSEGLLPGEATVKSGHMPVIFIKMERFYYRVWKYLKLKEEKK